MRMWKFTVHQTMTILGEGEAGLTLTTRCFKHGISNATHDQNKSKYACVSEGELQRIKDLYRLERMDVELALKNAAFKDVLSRKL